MKQFVIYSRKSRFTGKGESIENQIELCRQYIAAQHGPETAAAALVYEDEGFSGGTLERPQFKKMMNDSRTLQFTAIVVYRLDRISRNIGDFAKLIEDLNSRSIAFLSIREQFDTSSPMGRAMMYIASVFSQLERETIAERIRDNMHELAKTGRWLGGTTPIGYESESISAVSLDGKVRKACKLKSIPHELHLVQLIFDKFIETASLTKTVQFLQQNQYQTKRGNAFTRFAVKGILSNPVYLIADDDAYAYLTDKEVDLFSPKEDFDGIHGIMAYNRTLQRSGKSTEEKPMQEWILAVGQHLGIIPGTLWIQTQTLLEQNKANSCRKTRSSTALLSGLLHCSCGASMRPKRSAHTCSYSYLCRSKERSKGQHCSQKNLNGSQLDAKILELLPNWITATPDLAQRILRAKKRLQNSAHLDDSAGAELRSQIKSVEQDIKTLVRSLGKSENTHTEQYIMKQIEELHEQSSKLKLHLADINNELRQSDCSVTEFDRIRNQLSLTGNPLESSSLPQKRAAVRALIQDIIWDGEHIHVYLFHSTKPLGEDSK